MNEMINVFFAKVNEDAVIPTKRDEDGCYDVYANFEEEYIAIQPHQIKLIPTGLASACNSGYRMAVRDRGSNTKSGLITVAGQIDSGYRGEWFIALFNSNDVPVEITKSVDEVVKTEDYIRVPYSKAIAQFALEIVPKACINEIQYDELKKIDSERGAGALGSSGK